jgi:hypothetical protein
VKDLWGLWSASKVVFVVRLPLWNNKIWCEDLWWNSVSEEIWSQSTFPLGSVIFDVIAM